MTPPVPADPLPGRAWWGYSAAHERRYCVSGWKREDESLLTVWLLPEANVLVVLQGKALKSDSNVIGIICQSEGQLAEYTFNIPS